MRLTASSAKRHLPRRGVFVLAAAAFLGCGQIDDILEADVNEGYLVVATEQGQLSIAQGDEHTMTVRVTRPAGASPTLQVLFTAPTGITASFANQTTVDLVTTYDMTIHVAPTTTLGQHTLSVRSKGTRVNDGVAAIILTVAPPPAYALTVSRPEVTVARGGVAPLVARIARTNMPSDVTLSLVAPPGAAGGITASFSGNPVSADSSRMTLEVAASVPAGTYQVQVRGQVTDLAERTTSFSLVVTDDPLQLIAPAGVGGAQGAMVQTELILNRATFNGTVTFAAENLPSGVIVTFSGDAGSSSTPDMFVNIGPTAPPGVHAIRVRASGGGVPDAVTDVPLTVTPTSISIALQPVTMSLFVGTSGNASLTIARTGSASLVNIAVEGAPPGVTITPSSPSTTANSLQISAFASAGMAPGDYVVTVRATPDGFPISASQTVTLTITVREAAASGNVIVDFSTCVAPMWFAIQNGLGAWNTIAATAGVYRFTIDQSRGAYAYADDVSITVQYHTQAELTSAPINACGPKPGTKTVTGGALHQLANESFQHRLGGGSATTTPAQPNFTIANIADGPQDMVSWGVSGTSTRAYIRRDLDVADGENIGMVDLLGGESYAAKQTTFGLTGSLVLGETTLSNTMTYLTTAACVANPLYSLSNGFGANNQQMFGIPVFAQRPTDFHMLTVQTNAGSATFGRSVSMSFHDMVPRSLTLPPMPGAPLVQTTPHTYKILRATLAMLAQYQTGATLEYTYAGKTMRVSATVAYFGTTTFILAFPDLSNATGFPAASAIPSTAGGGWIVHYEGISHSGNNCIEGRVVNRARRNGNY